MPQEICFWGIRRSQSKTHDEVMVCALILSDNFPARVFFFLRNRLQEIEIGTEKVSIK